MYLGHKNVEPGLNCSHELATFPKYHMPLRACTLNFHLLYFDAKLFCHLLIFRLWRSGYPLHEPSVYSSLQLSSPQNWWKMQMIFQLFTNNL